MTPQICTLVFLIEGTNILLAMKKRGFGANRWNGVGGKVKQGETVAQAMIRECEEEISVSPLEFESAAYLEFLSQAGTASIIVHVFVCSAWDGEPLETEEMSPHWFKIRDIPYDEMWQGDRLWLPRLLDGKFVRGTFRFDGNDKLLDYKLEEA